MKKIQFLSTVPCGLLTTYLYLLLLLNCLIPSLIDTNQVKGVIVHNLQATQPNLKIKIERLQFSWLILPEIKISGLSIKQPEIFKAQCRQTNIYLNPIRLLQGKFRPYKISLAYPNIVASLPKKSKQGLQIAWLKQYPCLVNIEQGKISLQNMQGVLFLDHLDLRAKGDEQGFSLKGDSQINQQGKIALDVSSDWSRQEIKGKIQLMEIALHPLLQFLTVQGPGVGIVNGHLQSISSTFLIKKGKTIHIELKGSIPKLVLKGKNQAEFAIKHADLTLQSDFKHYLMKINQLNLDTPQAELTGQVEWHTPSAYFSLDLSGRNIDLLACRQKTETLIDNALAEEVFTIVRGGILNQFHLRLQGQTPAGLAKSLSLSCKLEKGHILIPNLDLDLKQVTGNVQVKADVLKGTNLSARLGNSTGRKGTLILGLNKTNRSFLLDLDLNADLAALPRVLKKTISSPTFLKELDQIDFLQGQAKGHLQIQGVNKKYAVKVLTNQFDLQGRHQKIPYPISIKGKSFSYQGEQIHGTGWQVQIGHSTIFIAKNNLTWTKDFHIQLEGSDGHLKIGELLHWLNQCPGVRNKLPLVKNPTGELHLQNFTLDLPLSRPQKTIYQMQGSIQDVQLVLTSLPWPITVRKSTFSTNNLETRLSNCECLLDPKSVFTLNATLPSITNLMTITTKSKFLTNIQGRCSAVHFNQLSQALGWPDFLQTKSDLAIQKALIAKNGSIIQVHSIIKNKNGQLISNKLQVTPRSIQVKQLSLQDQLSNCKLQLTTSSNQLFFAFSGKLDHGSLDRLLKKNPILSGELSGNFSFNSTLIPLHINHAQGELFLTGFTPHWIPQQALSINSIKVRGQKQRLTIEQAKLQIFDQKISLYGQIYLDPQVEHSKLFAQIDNLNWDALWTRLSPLLTNKVNNGFLKKQAGKLNLQINNLIFQGFCYQGTKGYVLYSPQKMQSRLKTNLCSIHLDISLDTSQAISLSIVGLAENASLEQVSRCLTHKKKLVSGSFQLKSNIYGSGQNSTELIKNLKGKTYFKSKQGRIYKFNILSKLLAILNSTEVLFGTIPDLEKKGFAYKKITAKAKISGPTLTISQGLINGKTMELAFQGKINLASKKLDLLVLTSPLKTVDRLVKNIPIVNNVLGGNLITIPMQIRGTIQNPKIIPLDPKAISKELLGILSRTLQLPLTIFQPLLPGKPITPKK